ncbi:MAG TPA: hypothetical protein VFS10_10480 [Pyrinomonadaceae bacterium]|nr:hypothetical protein [Pyrinomonadaceae bacterium]
MEIFAPTNPPSHLTAHEINKLGTWFTWSPEARRFCHDWGRRMRGAEPPRRIRLLGGIPYDQTYSGEARPLDAELDGQLMTFAEAFFGLEVPDDLMLLTDMMDAEFDGQALRSLLAYLRDALVRITGERMHALYSPIPTDEANGVEFLLHADLYLPRILFCVYEETPEDDTGASTFLPAPTFKRLLGGVRALPEEARQQLHSHLDDTHGEDHHDTFVNLLHGREHAWVDELEAALREHLFRVNLLYGQGYLINDRMWLHGRDAPGRMGNGIRMHRLIFNTKKYHTAKAGGR